MTHPARLRRVLQPAGPLLSVLQPVGPVLLGAGFATALGVTHVVLGRVPASTAAAWTAWSSTSLDNLAVHPVAVLVVSAIVMQDGPLPWMGLAVLAAWAAGRHLGVRLTAALAVLTHVLATGVSEGVLAWRIADGDEPASARGLLDVGPSYVVLSVLVAALVRGRGVERTVAAAAVVVVAPSLFSGLDRWDVAAVGHAATIVIAVALSGLLARPSTRTG